MTIAWITDVHLDHLTWDEARDFARSLDSSRWGAVVLTGDISWGSPVICPSQRAFTDYLQLMSEETSKPIYFVLGNHDSYGCRISESKHRARQIAAEAENLWYLGGGSIHTLGEGLCISGVDGWADGLCGSFMGSTVWLNDYDYIRDFKGLPKFVVAERLVEMGKSEARVAEEALLTFCDEREESSMVMLTHAPPFKGACWHGGEVSGLHYLPHFVSQQVGESLITVMDAYPEKKLTVLCGHTHSSGVYEPLENLRVITLGAVYGRPEVGRVLGDGDLK